MQSDLAVKNSPESIEDVNPIAAASTIRDKVAKQIPLKESNDKDKDKESLVPAEHFWSGYNNGTIQI